MPESPQPAAPSRPRLKFVLLGAAGGALILLPLGQVLRYQNADLAALATERAALDPLAQVVGVQRGVLAHRDAADLVLRGRATLEPERRERQAELDQQLRQLQDTLSAGWWVRALQESQSLGVDWRQLARRVALRQINAGVSLEAHQLLMEQAVQVLDLVQAEAPSSHGALLAQALHPLRPLHQRPGLLPADQQQALATLHAALQTQDTVLMTREAAVREQRAAVGLGLGALLSLHLGLFLAWAVRGRPTASNGNGPGQPENREDIGQRRSHGRRATDAAPSRDETAPLLERLRSGELLRTSEPR